MTRLGITWIQICQSHHCLIANHHSSGLLEGPRATKGKEMVMGAVSGTLGGGLKNQGHWEIFLTECLHDTHLVRIWVTMHLIVLAHIPKWRIGSHFVWGKFEFCAWEICILCFHFVQVIVCIRCGDNLYIMLEFCAGVVCIISTLVQG